MELDEISEVFKKLSESIWNMIIKPPVYNIESDKCDNNIIATRLKVLEESVSSQCSSTVDIILKLMSRKLSIVLSG